MATDGSLDISALARLKDGLNGMAVPDFGDLPDAAKELIYLAVSTAQTRTDRLPRIMHNRLFPLFPDLDAVSESDLSRVGDTSS